EFVQCRTTVVEEMVVGFEDGVGEPVVSHELPDVLDRVELWALRRQQNDGDIGRHEEAGGQVNAMHRRDRATLDHAGDGPPLSVVELGWLSCRLASQETGRTAGVEAQPPVPYDRKSDTADLGRLGARCPIVDSR